MATTVLVTGATGYIAQHIIKLLLAKKYSVVGTVRTIGKGNLLQRLFDSKHFTYEVVPVFETPNAFDQALKRHNDVTVVLHTASPVNCEISDVEKEFLVPAVEGVKTLFRAIEKYGHQITHVVVTSSVAAHCDFTRMTDSKYEISEDSWSPVTWEQALTSPFLGYYGSKKFAEKAAWDYCMTEKPGFVLNTVNPSYVFGPQAFLSNVKDELGYSAEIINKFLRLSSDSEIPNYSGGFVDVRDVARAHLAAFEGDISQQRLLLKAEPFTSQRLLEILRDHFDSLKTNLPVGESGQEPFNFVANFDNQKTRELLGFEFIGLEQSIIDSVTQILKARKRELDPPSAFSFTGNRDLVGLLLHLSEEFCLNYYSSWLVFWG